MELLQISSLDKVLRSKELNALKIENATILSGERFSYQIAYRSWFETYSFSISSDIPEIEQYINVYDVKNVPVETPTFAVNDTNYVGHDAGLYPDILRKNTSKTVFAREQYKSLWIELNENLPVGEHYITFIFKCVKKDDQYVPLSDEVLNATYSVTLKLNVLPLKLPKQSTAFTQWFYCDCIATYYGMEIFSEEHWSMIEKFMKTARRYGINVILTPLFTPPLDTKIGTERPTVQLVDVAYSNGKYTFGFEKLLRFIKMAREIGMEYFEMSHLFSQWGVEAIPKIMATVDGEYKRIFGWDVKSNDERYRIFLAEFLPQLMDLLEEEGIKDNTMFHISDEPNDAHIKNYMTAKEMIEPYIRGCKICDALSHYEFYKQGIVEQPAVASNCLAPFIENGDTGIWAYYCGGMDNGVSNRLIAMPSWRTRFIGYQLYKYNISGFLHWGYNFYYSRLSVFPVNPYMDTDAGDGGFSSGDSFSVYPGPDGPELSLRLVVFYEALQDISACLLLEKYIGHDAVVKLLEEEYGESIIFTKCVQNAKIMDNMRNRIYSELKKYC